MVCTLIVDEMNIRQQVFWSPHKNSYDGFISSQMTEHRESENEKVSDKIAKYAIVYMLHGINCCFEFHVAYWMIESINKHQRKDRVLEVIDVVTLSGVKIKMLVFDGCPSNIAMSELLMGKKLDPNSSEFQTFFVNPRNDEKIYLYLDPCHMAKLVRSTLNKRIILDENKQKIEWKYIQALYEFSQDNDFAVHKLTKKHMNWKRNPMNVRLAIQTLSDSVASAIELLMLQEHSEFVNSAATVKFLRINNTLFDILNTKDVHNNNIYKRALNPENKRIVVDFLQESIAYIKTLSVINDKGKLVPILNSRNKTGFLGMVTSITSLIQFYNEYVEDKKQLQSVPTYSLQQDMLEMFFGRIRSKNGFNNNPNVMQFKGAFRKLLCNIKIEAPESGNCRVFERSLPVDYLYSNVFTVSSKRPKIAFEEIEETYEQQKNNILDTVFNVDRIEVNDPLLESTTKYRIAYVAKEIEEKLLSRYECNRKKNERS